MNVTEEYKLSKYQDYGQLNNEKNIHLVRNIQDGKVCVKKVMDRAQKSVIEFRKNNPNCYLAEVYDCFVINDKLIVIEEYVEGVTLEQYTMGESLSEREATELGRQICLALQFLHQATPMIVYRDLKPQNVMVTKNNMVKLIDFDISREFDKRKTKDTQLLGTAEYAAPEQFGYFQTDNRTDIYAFGVLFNYMLTGKLPKEQLAEGKYRAIILKCIEFEPEKRFQTIDEVIDTLEVPKGIPGYVSKKSWAILGFRSCTWWKMVLAVIGYGHLTFLIWVFTMGDWVQRFCLVFFVALAILISGNFRGISNKNKILQSEKRIVRILGFIGVWIVCMLLGCYFALACRLVINLFKVYA